MPMRCPRCQGLMVTTRLNELGRSDTATGWRCLICGENVDSVIEGNRTGHALPVQSRARVPGSPAAKSAKGRFR
jgi:hypothetical protein